MAKIPQFTKEEYDAFAQSIDEGVFFEESRKFYTVVYMSILPERVYFIVVSALAGVAAMFALLALLQLLPVKPAIPLLFPMKNVVRDMPIIHELRDSPTQPVNEALQLYFVTQYVTKRENYSFDIVRANFRFLNRYSEKPVMDIYRRYIDPSSPRSPINLYERSATRTITIDNIDIVRVDREEDEYKTDGEYIATIDFRAGVLRGDKIETTFWQSQITFNYTQLKTEQPEDQVNGKLKIEPMEFTVTNYSISEAMPQTTR